MKTLRRLSFAMIVALALASCGSSKQTPEQKDQNVGPGNPPGTTLLANPCGDESRSDDMYLRECGIGEDPDLAEAKSKALKHAYSLMEQRLSREITAYYEKNKGHINSDSLSYLRTGALDMADNGCEANLWVYGQNTYRYYYTIQIMKEDFMKYLGRK